MIPGTHLKDVIFWSTIAFAFSGVESASVMADEIHDAKRNIPPALILAGVIMTVFYIAATASVLIAVPQKGSDRASRIHPGHRSGGVAYWIAADCAVRCGAGNHQCVGRSCGLVCHGGAAAFCGGRRSIFCRKHSGGFIPNGARRYIALLVQAAIAVVFRAAGPGRDDGQERL